MVRTIFIPQNETFVFTLPKQYIGKRLEITILPAEEISVEYIKPRKKVTFDTISLDTKGYKFDREEANAR